MAFAVVRAAITECLRTVKTCLISNGAMVEDRIFIIGREDVVNDVPHTQGDNDLVIKLSGLSCEQATVEGAGRVDTRLHSNLLVYIRSRLSVDESTRDFFWLTDAQLGHYALELAVMDALHIGFDGTDDTGNLLLLQPCRFLDSTDPVKGADGWGISMQRYDLLFNAKLDQTRQ